MTDQGAERAITASAAIVMGVYAYRRITEGASPTPSKGTTKVKQLAGEGTPPPVGKFVTAWGFLFLSISVVAQVSPGLGGSFAILIAVSDLLSNTQSVLADIGKAQANAGKGGGKQPGSVAGSAITKSGNTIANTFDGVGNAVGGPGPVTVGGATAGVGNAISGSIPGIDPVWLNAVPGPHGPVPLPTGPPVVSTTSEPRT